MRGLLALVFASVLVLAGQAWARTLIVDANTSDPAPRAAWEAVVADFQRENPGVEVKFNIYDHESYKKSIRNWLTGASPDVVFWFGGNRMREFVGRQLLTEVSELFRGEVLSRAGIDLVSVDGRQYGVPYSYYQIGFYFRRDLLDRAGVKQAPTTWADLVETCQAVKADGVEPFAIASGRSGLYSDGVLTSVDDPGRVKTRC
jgi:multiple sugar transport system substrate-binding protein